MDFRRLSLFIVILTLPSLLGCDFLKKPKTSGSNLQNDPVLQPIADVNKAVKRAVSMNDLKSLQLFIDTFSLAEGKMPNSQDILKAVAQADKKLHKLLVDKEIMLTGSTTRESVWAYEKEAPNSGGLILTNQGVEKVTAEQAKQRIGLK